MVSESTSLLMWLRNVLAPHHHKVAYRFGIGAKGYGFGLDGKVVMQVMAVTRAC